MSTHNRPLRKIQSTKSVSDNREVRKVPVPSHRLTPLKEHWLKIYTPVVDHLRMDIRFNVKSRNVEIRNPVPDDEIGSQHLQKAADFVKAFVYGFEVEDALALIRLDNLFVESFEVKDVKTLKGDHLSRAIGRLAGKGGRTKFTIENVTKTRIVLADTKIHILGSFQNIQVAMRAICNLILGSPPSKVYGQLQQLSKIVQISEQNDNDKKCTAVDRTNGQYCSRGLSIVTKRKGQIKVQPTSISRRRQGVNRGSRRIPSGRPPTSVNKTKVTKKSHNIGKYIKLGQLNAKYHGRGH